MGIVKAAWQTVGVTAGSAVDGTVEGVKSGVTAYAATLAAGAAVGIAIVAVGAGAAIFTVPGIALAAVAAAVGAICSVPAANVIGSVVGGVSGVFNAAKSFLQGMGKVVNEKAHEGQVNKHQALQQEYMQQKHISAELKSLQDHRAKAATGGNIEINNGSVTVSTGDAQSHSNPAIEKSNVKRYAGKTVNHMERAVQPKAESQVRYT